jgi:hypothetical protein
MAGIFISYRREDSAGWTGRLSAYLREQFGVDSVFSDIDTIEPGADFTDAITCAVGSCDVLLAVIGPRWLMETDTNNKQRLDDPADWVRTEIAAAFSRKIRVIPVLVGKTSMPAVRDLPPEIKALADRQAHELSDKRWDYDCQQLASRLEKTLAIPRKPTQRRLSPKTLLLGTLASVIASAGIAYLFFGNINILSLRQSPSPDFSFNPSQTMTEPVQQPLGLQPRQASAAKQKTGSGAASYPIHLRANQEARLIKPDHTYKILAAELDRSNSSTLLLRFVVRLTNNGRYDANFWNASFRLLVDGVPRSPVGNLNELVAGHSAKEGTVEFTIPDQTPRVILQLNVGGEVADIPIDLTETFPKPQPVRSSPNSKLLNAKFPMHLRANQEVQLNRPYFTYKVLSTELDRPNSSTLLLRFHIRFTNNGGAAANFWNASFRLLVDGVPRAPVSNLNGLVDSHSAKEGTVEFTLPDTTTGVILQLRDGGEVVEIPIDLTQTL